MSGPVAPVEADSFPYDGLRIVLVSPRNPLNIGAAARAMSNFGFTRLRLVNAYDVAYQEARSAVGASPILQEARNFGLLAEAIADCGLVVGATSVGHRELKHSLRRLEYGARALRQHLREGPAALLFGSEKYGLSNEDLSYCHWLVRIPARRDRGSMNLGQAVAVCLYEFVRSSAAASARPARPTPAPGGDLDRLTESWLEALTESGYVNPVTSHSTRLKLRRLFRRLRMGAEDCELMLGMLRQIQWKLESARGEPASRDAEPRR
ncbi:MAG: RNA methyltransferase [Bryobacteraceae bacterium]|nr:RNA methyltransferase [Bryobacteraceae bacterium]